MPASVLSISGKQEGTYVLLELCLPERAPRPVGVLLMDCGRDRMWIRMCGSWERIADPHDVEVLETMEGHLLQLAEESGAKALLAFLEDSASNVLRVSERHEIAVDAFSRTLDRLYSEHVDAVAVKPFVTHLPLFSLRAAAGNLGEEMQSEAEDWIAAPEGMRLTPDLFMAHVTGRSMEPRIPDGSLNLFRLNPAGSRQGRILLIQRFGVLDETARYTVKRYTSVKSWSGEDEWRHERIRLEPLNPEYEPWDVGPEDFAVVAEWLRVIE